MANLSESSFHTISWQRNELHVKQATVRFKTFNIQIRWNARVFPSQMATLATSKFSFIFFFFDLLICIFYIVYNLPVITL